jgi:fatty acid desaturase
MAAVKEPKKYRADLLAFVGHLALWFVLPLILGVDPLRMLCVYLIASSLLGMRLAAVFTVNHVGMPTAPDGVSHFEHQIVTSRNIDNPWWLDWFFGGLNFQIEHHLVPACPRRLLRRARRIVRPMVVEAGLKHHECSWPRAVADVTRHLAGVVTTHARAPATLPQHDGAPAAPPG